MEFEDYVAQRLPELVRIARVISGERHLGEDLVQDVLLKMHSRWPAISAMAKPDAYVRRMLVNESLSWRRRWGRQQPFGDVIDDRADPAGDLSVVHADREALVAEVRRLPPKQRAVVTLRYLVDLSDVEIAEIVGCSPDTVRAHAVRALKKLRVSPLRESVNVR